MPSGSGFVGAGFKLQSITQTGPASFRLAYTNDPLAASSAGANDALNITNYLLTGPALNTISQIFTVGGDPMSFDFSLASPLVAGTWTLAVSNVETPLGAALTAPTSLSFTATELPVIVPLSLGGVDDDEEDLIRKHLSPALKGDGWNALIAALATGDKYRNDTARSAFDQLFKSTASGVFLDRRAQDDGFSRPADIGISDEVFRKLAIKTTARKLVIEVILEALEAYYGSEATRAYTTSSMAEPYQLEIGDTLIVQTDNSKKITVLFEQDDFTALGGAKAIEVASVITRELKKVGSTAYAVAFKDPAVSATFVRIFSGALGLTGSIRIHGGRAQNALLFPTEVHPTAGDGPQPTTQLSILPGTGINGVPAGRVRFTHIGGTNPDLQEVRTDDYVNIFGGVFAAAFRGVYVVADSTPTTFDLIDSKLTWPASVTLTDAKDMRFYRPTARTISSTGRLATATQGDPSKLEVILPATTQAVGRTRNTGAYLHIGTSSVISSASRATTGIVSVATSTAHTLAVGDWVFIDNLRPVIGGIAGLGWATAEGGTGSLPYDDSAALKLSDGRVLQAGGSLAGVRQSATHIFDPTTNTWSTKTVMARARRGHTLTLLNTGKILVVGGNNASNVCELYDIGTNTWTDTGALAAAHDWHTATLLNDGKVLVIGGGNPSEIYDPVTGLWSVLANQPAVARSKHTATKLYDGRVLVAGGGSALPTGVNTAEVYNHVTGLWVTTGNMTSARWGHQAVLLPRGTSGNVLIAGGSTDGSVILANCDLFNPATMTFTAGPAMTNARLEAAMTVRSDGMAQIAGGLSATGPNVFLNNSEIYDFINNTWSTATGSYADARATHDLINLNDGRLLMVGGETAAANSQAFKYTGSPVNAGQMNGLFRVATAPTSTTFTYLTPEALYATTFAASTGTATTFKSGINGIQGPFIYDTEGGSAITAVATTLTEQLTIGNSYNVINVAAASSFPDEPGYLAFGFGTDKSVTPVQYLGRISATHLLLDPSFVLPKTLPSGTSVTLLEQRGAWEPGVPEEAGTFYLTAAAAGRVAASQSVDNLVAAGVHVDKTIVYPGDIGLGNEGQPAEGVNKISDKVVVWGGDDVDEEVAAAREGDD